MGRNLLSIYHLPRFHVRLYFFKGLPKICNDFRKHYPAIPPLTKDSPKRTLVLDMDDTILQYSLEEFENPDVVVSGKYLLLQFKVFARLRPFLLEFLETLSPHYEIVLFTASCRFVVECLIRKLDPKRKYIRHMLFREHCLEIGGYFLKDIRMLGRDLSKTVIVDNTPESFGFQVDNGFPISSWTGSKQDTALRDLMQFLLSLLSESALQGITNLLRKQAITEVTRRPVAFFRGQSVCHGNDVRQKLRDTFQISENMQMP